MPYEKVNMMVERQLMRTENFVDYHQEFQRLLCGKQIGTVLKQLSNDVKLAC